MSYLAISFGESEQEAVPTIAFFLHMYQPPLPVQTMPILKRIIENCYIPVTQGLLEHPMIRITVNINASLSEMLLEQAPEVIDNLMLLSESNQIEFLDSAAYHPLLPLLPKKHQEAQIKLNREINQKIFGKNNFKPVGFFPPELAIDRELPYDLLKMGYEYFLAPSSAFAAIANIGIPYLVKEKKRFYLLPRNRTLSNDLAFKNFPAPENFIQAVNHFSEGNVVATPIVGMDFETFGEHHHKYEEFLFKSLSNLRTLQLRELIQLHDAEETDYEISSKDFRESSWSTSEHEIQQKIPYPLWDHPWNSLHQLTLELMHIVYEGSNLLENSTNTDLIPVYKSQQSCQLWWESDGRFGPDIVKRAINFQVKALESLAELAESQNSQRALALKSLVNLGHQLVDKIEYLVNLKS